LPDSTGGNGCELLLGLKRLNDDDAVSAWFRLLRDMRGVINIDDVVPHAVSWRIVVDGQWHRDDADLV